jgi:MFS family permease
MTPSGWGRRVGARIMGAIFGAAGLASRLGMALGPLAGGWVYEAFGSHTWLFIGSCGAEQWSARVTAHHLAGVLEPISQMVAAVVAGRASAAAIHWIWSTR